MDMVLKLKNTPKFFAFIFLLITLAHIIVKSIAYFVGDRHVVGLYHLVSLFDLDKEKSIPTFCSTIAILSCSVLLAFIAFTKKKIGEGYFYWLGLSIIFLFLSVDEFTCIHERLVKPFQHTLNTTGINYFAWIIPYSIILTFFLLAYTKFIINLPGKIRFLFIIAGLLYITGAIGFEFIGGRYHELYGERSITYLILMTIEECLEMTGIIIFIHTLTLYIDSQLKNAQLRILSS
ncbi:MAG: hypothetical protein E3K32_05790 [wastewater metagenome]|nr:hypothetical protein [Candidatus Loosdrechtia aerotolerans]